MNTTTTSTKYIAYYRVSTTKQGESGLGLEAQRAAVRHYMSAQQGAELIFEFTEVEESTLKGGAFMQRLVFRMRPV